MARKAAFQMSLGFIIAVVFAIVLLSLALVWLRGLIENVIGITDDLTQESQSTLRDTFRTTQQDFAVWPSQYNLDPGKGLRLSAGIENDAQDGKSHLFVINVIPASAGDNVLSSKGCTTFASCTTLKQDMLKWTTFDQTVGRIGIGAVGFKFVELRPPANAVKGTYIFNVVSCYDESGGAPSSQNCQQSSPNLWGGSAQQIIITIN